MLYTAEQFFLKVGSWATWTEPWGSDNGIYYHADYQLLNQNWKGVDGRLGNQHFFFFISYLMKSFQRNQHFFFSKFLRLYFLKPDNFICQGYAEAQVPADKELILYLRWYGIKITSIMTGTDSQCTWVSKCSCWEWGSGC